ncbi:MAG: glycosyltransferase [Acidobacteriota bacterium]
MSQPLVSVIVAVRNGDRFLTAALESIIDQVYSPLEIVVIDGESKDATSKIAKSFKSVRYLRQMRRGIADAYNMGISEARGELISFLSHDDLWVRSKLAVQVSHLANHPDVEYVTGKARFFLEPGYAAPKGFRPELFEGEHIAHIMETLLARRTLFERIGGFDATLPFGEDVDWFARARDEDVPMAVIPDVLVHKRIHDQNSSMDAHTGGALLLKLMKRSIERKKSNS